MAGPVVMMLGGFAFEAIGFGMDGLQRTISTPWTEDEVVSVLNPQQWTGPKSDEITIKGVLFPAEYGGQGSLDGLTAMAFAGQPAMFVSGTAVAGVILGYFTIQGIDEDRSLLTALGVARRNAYSIRLKRADGSLAGLSTLVGALVTLFG